MGLKIGWLWLQFARLQKKSQMALLLVPLYSQFDSPSFAPKVLVEHGLHFPRTAFSCPPHRQTNESAFGFGAKGRWFTRRHDRDKRMEGRLVPLCRCSDPLLCLAALLWPILLQLMVWPSAQQ